MANIFNKKKLVFLPNYVFIFTKKPEKTYVYTIHFHYSPLLSSFFYSPFHQSFLYRSLFCLLVLFLYRLPFLPLLSLSCFLFLLLNSPMLILLVITFLTFLLLFHLSTFLLILSHLNHLTPFKNFCPQPYYIPKQHFLSSYSLFFPFMFLLYPFLRFPLFFFLFFLFFFSLFSLCHFS